MSVTNPFIHLFKTSKSSYLYDVNKNQIKKISEASYIELCNDKDISKSQNTEIIELLENGFLKSERVEKSQHGATNIFPFLVDNKLTHLILQVTQRCNLRCEYCVYSGSYKNRNHSSQEMSWHIAKKAIDYFISHSRDTNPLMISFYGGEPLLNLPLMKQCMDYVGDNVKGKLIKFSITTNGTLLSPSVIDLLKKYDVSITISLDGPRKRHDKYRKFEGSSKGSFDLLCKNVKTLSDKYSTYLDHILFNTVLDPKLGYQEIGNFINKNLQFINFNFMINLIDTNYTELKNEISEDFIAETEYEYFLFLLEKLGCIKVPFPLKYSLSRYNSLIDRILKSPETNSIGPVNHHGGPCLPGVMRMFVNVLGDIYPCERVSELSDIAKIGNIDSGIDVEKAISILNIEKYTADKCKECWCYRFCTVCIKAMDGLDHIDYGQMSNVCQSSKFSTESQMKDFCVLEDLGYDFFEEKNRRIRFGIVWR